LIDSSVSTISASGMSRECGPCQLPDVCNLPTPSSRQCDPRVPRARRHPPAAAARTVRSSGTPRSWLRRVRRQTPPGICSTDCPGRARDHRIAGSGWVLLRFRASVPKPRVAGLFDFATRTILARLGGRVVMQRPAKPSTPVRFRPWRGV
jgi:hypothetical protein